MALIALVAGGGELAPAAAVDGHGHRPAAHAPTPRDRFAGMSGEEIVEEGLADEGFATEAVEIGLDGIEIVAESEGDGDFTMRLDLASGSSRGTLTVSDTGDGGSPAVDVYAVEIEESTEERAVFDLTDLETGEVLHYDSAAASPSIAFAIPIAFAAVSLGTALYYLAVGAAIVISGVLALETAKAVSKILEENAQRSSTQRRYYYPAVRKNGKVYISGRCLTTSQALARGRKGWDVWATSRGFARSLAQKLNPSRKPIRHLPHKPTYLEHYHPFRHSPEMHAFYGLPS
ncbi:hypothetical protein [Demequina subtropica]|uniref:hypothetical protein n=1 Tax=Demequina subtropica TaxID=1638989 RepID=UPI000780D67E|nr:hypothetical protein [Demequina subtropica]